MSIAASWFLLLVVLIGSLLLKHYRLKRNESPSNKLDCPQILSKLHIANGVQLCVLAIGQKRSYVLLSRNGMTQLTFSEEEL